jgi:hypothetical protein
LSYVDEYEVTTACSYSLNKDESVEIHKNSWEVHEDGKVYFSLLPPAVVIQLVKQLAKQLGY